MGRLSLEEIINDDTTPDDENRVIDIDKKELNVDLVYRLNELETEENAKPKIPELSIRTSN